MAFCSSSNLKSLFVSLLLIFMILFHTAIQLQLCENESNDDTTTLQIFRNRLKKREISDVSNELEKEDKDWSRTLPKPTLTSTPFPTLTTESSEAILSPSSSTSSPELKVSKNSSLSSKNWPHITDWSDVPEHLFIRNHYKGNFSYPNPELCSEKRNLVLLILISSALDNFQHRNNVRLSWGHYGRREDVQLAFVIGDGLMDNYNASVQSALMSEVDLYQDFIIADFNDTYRSLTLKTLHMMDWVNRYCSNVDYFLKTDDDVFLNVPKILDFIASVKKDDANVPKIYGHIFSGHFPKRDTSHKHHLKYDIYPHNASYPNFTSGPAYLMSARIVGPLFNEAFNNLPLIPLEDVLINGFAAMNLGIPRVDVDGFRNEMQNPVELSACALLSICAGMTDGSAVQMNYVWFNYLMGRSVCIWKS